MNNTTENYLSGFKNKSILIQGLGVNGGGTGAALFFLENGFDITITDLKTKEELARSLEQLKPYEGGIKYVLGEHREEDFRKAHIIVKGPGVPPDNKYIIAAKESGANIISDIEIFLNLVPCPVYAVTGSKGKSTTVSAIYRIFKTASENAFLGGNITISPLTFYRELNEKSLVVLELSSWQLRDIEGKGFRFKGTAVTNLLKDHLNYYLTMENYLKDKVILTENQTNEDFCIIPYKDRYITRSSIKGKALVFDYSFKDPGSNIYFSGGKAFFREKNKITELFDAEDVKIHGEHMLSNLLLAAGFCKLAGIPDDKIVEGVRTFRGVPYRLELVREWNGIKFINDTTATMPDAAGHALRSFKAPIIWIAGGNDKNLDFSVLKDAVNIPKKIYLLKGNGTEQMKNILAGKDFIESDSLHFIMEEVRKTAVKGDIVLFSPGCTSFGLFQNEFHRGDVFNQIVRSL